MKLKLFTAAGFGPSCFKSLIQICHRMHQSTKLDNHKRSIMLSTYVDYLLTNGSYSSTNGSTNGSPVHNGVETNGCGNGGGEKGYFATMSRLVCFKK